MATNLYTYMRCLYNLLNPVLIFLDYLLSEMNQMYNMYGMSSYQNANALTSSTTTPIRNPAQHMPMNYAGGQYPGQYGNDAMASNYNVIQPQMQQQYPGLLQQQQPSHPVQSLQTQQQSQTSINSSFGGIQPLQTQQQQNIPALSLATQEPIAQPAAVQPLQNINANQQQVLKTWNSAYNNAPVEKGPPVNVVITSSDPLPPAQSIVTSIAQPTLSVTIPPQHIKNNSLSQMAPSKANPTIMAALQEPQVKPLSLIQPKANVTEKDTKTSSSTPSVLQQKSIFGNTTFSPSLFSSPTTNVNTSQSVAENLSTDKAKKDATKPNPFASFSFGSALTNASATATPPKPFGEAKVEKPNFNNLFSDIGKTPAAVTPVVEPARPTANTAANTSATRADEDDYVPTAHFEPVISLPDLVEVKTGEENEDIAFEHRAKLLRFVKESKEWKERGIGNMKVLVNRSDPNKVRLLMRREQVFKLCCNQMLEKDAKFNKLPKSETAMSWIGQDYSENRLETELLAIRFKTADTCKQFHDAILKAQANMKTGADDKSAQSAAAQLAAPAAKPKENGKKEAPKGFGDQFKQKAGAWNCEACYITNKKTDKKCVACNTPKDKNAIDTTDMTKAAPKSQFSFGIQPTAAPVVKATPVIAAPVAGVTPGFGFGDKFKPKVGAWECKSCYTSNDATQLRCLACEELKEGVTEAEAPKADTNIFGTPSKSF